MTVGLCRWGRQKKAAFRRVQRSARCRQPVARMAFGLPMTGRWFPGELLTGAIIQSVPDLLGMATTSAEDGLPMPSPDADHGDGVRCGDGFFANAQGRRRQAVWPAGVGMLPIPGLITLGRCAVGGMLEAGVGLQRLGYGMGRDGRDGRDLRARVSSLYGALLLAGANGWEHGVGAGVAVPEASGRSSLSSYRVASATMPRSGAKVLRRSMAPLNFATVIMATSPCNCLVGR